MTARNWRTWGGLQVGSWTVFSAHPLISIDRAADDLIDALVSESLLELAWEEHGFRGPLGTIGKARNAGLLAVRMLGTHDDKLRARVEEFQAGLAHTILEKDEKLRDHLE